MESDTADDPQCFPTGAPPATERGLGGECCRRSGGNLSLAQEARLPLCPYISSQGFTCSLGASCLASEWWWRNGSATPAAAALLLVVEAQRREYCRNQRRFTSRSVLVTTSVVVGRRPPPAAGAAAATTNAIPLQRTGAAWRLPHTNLKRPARALPGRFPPALSRSPPPEPRTRASPPSQGGRSSSPSPADPASGRSSDRSRQAQRESALGRKARAVICVGIAIARFLLLELDSVLPIPERVERRACAPPPGASERRAQGER